MRPKLTKKNKYYLSKHRAYELKHFCLQYAEWKESYLELNGLENRGVTVIKYDKYRHSNPTERLAFKKLYFSRRMDMIKKAAEETDPILSNYILLAVTNDLSYDTLRVKYDIPCCKATYYDKYHEFFYYLDKMRD
jgi:hypothetical protein